MKDTPEHCSIAYTTWTERQGMKKDNGVADVELPGVGWQIIDYKGDLVYFRADE